jgi:hypothetical protein
MVQLIRDYDNGILTVVGSVKFDDTGDFLTRMDKLQKAINVLKEEVHQTLVDEWIEASESKDQFIENEEASRSHNEDHEMWEAEQRLAEWEREQGLYWEGNKEEEH